MFYKNTALLAILTLGFLLRLIVVLLVPDYFLFPDSKDYHIMAHNYIQGKDLIIFDTLYATRPPLYSLFLAFLYSLGLDPLGALLVQVFLGTGMILCQYYLAILLFQNNSIALVSSLFLALDPFFILFGALLLTEILFSLLFLCLMFVLFKLRLSPKRLPWLYAGFLLGLGCLCRDALLGFMAFALFFSLRPPYALSKCLLLISGALLVIFPWTLRNWCYLNQVVLITSKKGTNLYEAFGPGATGGCAIMEMKLPEETEKMNEAEQDAFLTKWVLNHILQNPQKAIELAWVKFVRFWNVSLNYEVLRKHPINLAIIAFSIVIYCLATVGFLLGEKKKILLLLLPVFYFTLLHLVFLGSVRYRIPIMPYLEILASFGLVNLWKKYRIFMGHSS